MMTNFDKLKDTTFAALFHAMNGDEPSMSVFANFMYRWTSCKQCPCFKDCSANFVDCYSTKIRSPSTCQSQLYKWLESEFEEDSQQSTSLDASQGDLKESENIQMGGHIEYINGFPMWVDEDTNLKTSFTSVSLGIAKDLPYYSSTTTTPIEDFNIKDK